MIQRLERFVSPKLIRRRNHSPNSTMESGTETESHLLLKKIISTTVVPINRHPYFRIRTESCFYILISSVHNLGKRTVKTSFTEKGT